MKKKALLKTEDGGPRRLGIRPSVWDALRQLPYPVEFRIPLPGLPADVLSTPVSEPGAPLRPEAERSLVPDQMVAEIGTCLWYLKTKYFKRAWESPDAADDDPRVRRALGRLAKGIDALQRAGIEIKDPTNSRYPPGGENLMRPIQFQPTAGLTYEKVQETVTPIIYRKDRLIQRGEVFVAVPPPPPAGVKDPGVTSSAACLADGAQGETPPVAEPPAGPQVELPQETGDRAGPVGATGTGASSPTDKPGTPHTNSQERTA